MSDADKTPIDGLQLSTRQIVREIRTTQVAMYEQLKAYRAEVLAYRAEQQSARAELAALKRERWTPVLISLAAALFSLACAFAAR